MKLLIARMFAVLAVTVLLGCAGRDFVRPSSDTFKLGQSTYSQVIAQLGEPRRVGDVMKNGKNIKTITYSYAAYGEPLEAGVVPGRGMSYYFSDDILVGQEFRSSFKSDHSNFDDKQIDKIVKGSTTRDQVVQLLGKPTASYVSPMVKTTSGETIGYNYATLSGNLFSGLKVFQKALAVSFDATGSVSDIEFSSSDSK